MKEIESVRKRMDGEPTFRNKQVTIATMLHSLAQGDSIKEFAENHEMDIKCIRSALRDIADNIRLWMRPKELYELWEDNNKETTFTTANNIGELMNNGMLSHHAQRTWSIMAESTNEAFGEYNKHMKWEEHKPMLNCSEEPYPEDEGDTVVEDENCGCGDTLDSCGYCVDLDCPYSECLQHEEPEDQ